MVDKFLAELRIATLNMIQLVSMIPYAWIPRRTPGRLYGNIYRNVRLS